MFVVTLLFWSINFIIVGLIRSKLWERRAISYFFPGQFLLEPRYCWQKVAGKYDESNCFVKLLASGPCSNFFTNSRFVSWNLTTGSPNPDALGHRPLAIAIMHRGKLPPFYLSFIVNLKCITRMHLLKVVLHMDIVFIWWITPLKYTL